ncbi:MAG: SMI1/KNR4 family protein [Lachnospiraceae bacterium]|nr:SMI1/KNR4 family protein [Lachnospiraceae bacterium]
MISEELKTIVDKLVEQGRMSFLPETTEEKITEFEAKNNVKLPQKYKEWLEFSDGGEFFLPAGVQMYGVEHKPLIDVEDLDKPEEKYIVIGTLASGDPILCDKTSEKISIYNHEDGRVEEDEIYESFIDFLNDLYDLLGIGG